jgi:hypothetical protein
VHNYLDQPPRRRSGFPSWTPDSKEIRFVNYLGATISVWTYRLSDGALKKRFEQPSALCQTAGKPKPVLLLVFRSALQRSYS